MLGGGYIACFIGREAGKALFIGLYSIGPSKPLTVEDDGVLLPMPQS